jgi:hypothetical protein
MDRLRTEKEDLIQKKEEKLETAKAEVCLFLLNILNL